MGHRELGGQREADLDSAEYRSTGRVVKVLPVGDWNQVMEVSNAWGEVCFRRANSMCAGERFEKAQLFWGTRCFHKWWKIRWLGQVDIWLWEKSAFCQEVPGTNGRLQMWDWWQVCFRNHSDSSKEACLARVRLETCCLSEKATCTEVIEEGPAERTRLFITICHYT